MPFLYPDDPGVSDAPVGDLLESARKWKERGRLDLAGALHEEAYARFPDDRDAFRGAVDWRANEDRTAALTILGREELAGRLTSPKDYQLWFALSQRQPAMPRQGIDIADRYIEAFPDAPEVVIEVVDWYIQCSALVRAWGVIRSQLDRWEWLPPARTRMMRALGAILQGLGETWDERQAAMQVLRTLSRLPGDHARLTAADVLVSIDPDAAEEVLALIMPSGDDDDLEQDIRVVRSSIAFARQESDAVLALLSQLSIENLGPVQLYQLAISKADAGMLADAISTIDFGLERFSSLDDQYSWKRLLISSFHLARYSPAYNSGRFREAWESIKIIRTALELPGLDENASRSFELMELSALRPVDVDDAHHLPEAAGWASAEDRGYEVARLGLLQLAAERIPNLRPHAESALVRAFHDLQARLEMLEWHNGSEIDRDGLELALDLAYVALLLDEQEFARVIIDRIGAGRRREKERMRQLDAHDRSFLALRAHAALRAGTKEEAERALSDVELLRRSAPHVLEYRLLQVHALVSTGNAIEAERLAEELCDRFPSLAAAQLWRAELLLQPRARHHHDASAEPAGGQGSRALSQSSDHDSGVDESNDDVDDEAIPLERLLGAMKSCSSVIEAERRLQRFLDDLPASSGPIGSDLLAPREIAYAARRGLHAAVRAERLRVRERLPRDDDLKNGTRVLLSALRAIGPAESAEADRLERMFRRPSRRRKGVFAYKLALPLLVLAFVLYLTLFDFWPVVGETRPEVLLFVIAIVVVLLAWPYVRAISFSGLSFEKAETGALIGDRDSVLLANLSAGTSVLRMRAISPPTNLPTASKAGRPEQQSSADAGTAILEGGDPFGSRLQPSIGRVRLDDPVGT